MYYREQPQGPIDLEFDRQVRVYQDCLPKNIYNDEITILYLSEPDVIYGLADYVIDKCNYNYFDFILTFNKKALAACPNAVKFEFGTTWIYGYKFKEKEFGVSTIIGNKQKTPGHLLRHDLWLRRGEITVPSCFYISAHGGPENTDNCPVLGKKSYEKHIAYNTQYHIAIESSNEDYYFSEKLIDCFQTKAVPVYWGCPAIGDYFNTDGMIIAGDIDEMMFKVNSLKPDDYEKMARPIEENYELSKAFTEPPHDRMKSKLTELIELAKPAYSHPEMPGKA
jgi:hypothetical protein